MLHFIVWGIMTGKKSARAQYKFNFYFPNLFYLWNSLDSEVEHPQTEGKYISCHTVVY
jgi:hypothetical protein